VSKYGRRFKHSVDRHGDHRCKVSGTLFILIPCRLPRVCAREDLHTGKREKARDDLLSKERNGRDRI